MLARKRMRFTRVFLSEGSSFEKYVCKAISGKGFAIKNKDNFFT
jgi:hypothetical protein